MDINRYRKYERSMTNIKPNENQIKRIKHIRGIYKNVLLQLDKNCNDGRELALALTKIEESLMWAVKSIVLEKDEN